MRMARLLVVLAVLLLAVLTPVAVAQATPAFVRASSRSEAIAVGLGASGGGGTVWMAADGLHFVRHEVAAGRWILDVHLTATGEALLATSAVPRGGPILVTRLGSDPPVEREIVGSQGMSDVRFVEGRNGRLAIVTSSGAFMSGDEGRTFTPFASWDVDVYGFYAASARVTPEGGVEVLAPTFNTCSSSDFLEELTHLRARPGGRTRARAVPLVSASFPIVAQLGADGELVTLTRRGDSCVLRVSTEGGARDVRRAVPDCSLLAQTGLRFTLAVLGERVVRITGLSSSVLGALGSTESARDITPDARGRALVLLDDGRVVRYSARAAPEVVFRSP